MTTEAQPAQVPAPTKLSMAARLILRVLASNPNPGRPYTVTELARLTPCSHGTAFQITKKLTSAGFLNEHPAEYGVPKSFTISSIKSLTSPTSPTYDEPLARMLGEFDVEVEAAQAMQKIRQSSITYQMAWSSSSPDAATRKSYAEVCGTLLGLITGEPGITAGELILRSGCSAATVSDWLGEAKRRKLITKTFRSLPITVNRNPSGENAEETYTVV